MTACTHLRSFLVITLAAALGTMPHPPVALAGTAPLIFTVNSTDWHDCDSNAPSQITLGCAIDKANAAPADAAKTIRFAIPSSDPGCTSGVCTISPHGNLPVIAAARLIIDGYSQTGARRNSNDLHSAAGDNAAITVHIEGAKAPPGSYALQVRAPNVTVAGLSVTNFTQRLNKYTGQYMGGVAVTVSGAGVTGVRIVGNWLGVLPNNTSGRGNAYGIEVRGGATGTSIGGPSNGDRNIISGNTVAGILLSDSTSNLIQGNDIGTDRTGGAALPNGYGIVLTGEGTNDPQKHTGTGDTIGGTAAGAGNIISGNKYFGVLAATDTQSNTAATRSAPTRLHVGFSSRRPQPEPSSRKPVAARVGTRDLPAGGPALSAARNGNGLIEGNRIGTDATGARAVPNGTSGASLGLAAGIALWDAYTFTVGGTAKGAGNLISGNAGDGMAADGPVFYNRPQPDTYLRNHLIVGNVIGVSVAGSALPNKGNGVSLVSGSSDEVTHNTIADNGRVGVQAGNSESDLTWVWVTQNSMYGNGLAGLILGAPPGNAADVQARSEACLTEYNLDTNDEQIPCPVIKSATTDQIMGEAANYATVELFLAAGASDDEGRTYLGSVDVPGRCTSDNCTGVSDWKISTDKLSVKPRPGQYITVTVTERPTYGIPPQYFNERMGVTSQFSRAAPVGVPLKVTTTADLPVPCKSTAYSLRCAISQANVDKAGDRIDFAIPSSDAQCATTTKCHVSFSQGLPTITASSTMMNGYSQGGHPNTNHARSGDNAIVPIWLDSKIASASPAAGSFSADLVVKGAWDTVEGLALGATPRTVAGDGIDISGPGAQWDMVLGNFIGLHGDGSSTGPPINGVSVMDGASHALIGFLAPGDDNVLSGNGVYGLSLGGTDLNSTSAGPDLVMGNYIGTNPAGTAALGNGVSGINLDGTQRAGIGAYQAIQDVGNLVSGNAEDGIDEIAGHENYVAGNGIGVGAPGSGGPVALPNGLSGVWMYAGLENTFTSNDIAGNGADGVDSIGETDFGFEHNSIAGNGSIIGGGGVYVTNAADTEGNTAGRRRAPTIRSGSAAGGYGELDGDISQNQITGNHGPGIQLGRPGAGQSDSHIHVSMSQNAMAANKGLGIVLSDSPADCSTGSPPGPNDYLQCPTIFDAQPTLVYGGACAGCLVEVFSADTYGQGQQYLGSTKADSQTGFWSLNLSSSPQAEGTALTATATATPQIGPAETSEFSASMVVHQPN